MATFDRANILAAIHALHHPATAQAARVQADAFLRAWQQDDSAWELSLQMLAAPEGELPTNCHFTAAQTLRSKLQQVFVSPQLLCFVCK